jgi:hypothetical protein
MLAAIGALSIMREDSAPFSCWLTCEQGLLTYSINVPRFPTNRMAVPTGLVTTTPGCRRLEVAFRKMADRVDENGAAYAGSQLQTQLYVNKRTEQLDTANRAAFAELADAAFEWCSPLADEHYAEYWDAAFLKRLKLDDHVEALAKFWPERGGPHWDALAVVALPHQPTIGMVLAEGKSYPDEMLKGSPVGATDPTSKSNIEKALAWTQGTLGIPFELARWLGPLYQNANRLAHVYWLRSRGVRAWLVHLLFTDDPHGPTSAAEWEAALEKADAGLGLAGVAVGAAAHIHLPAGTRDEFLS